MPPRRLRAAAAMKRRTNNRPRPTGDNRRRCAGLHRRRDNRPRPATTATIAATAAATAGRTLFTRTRFVDGQRTALEVLGMEHLDGLIRVLLGAHLDEGEAARPTRHAVLHDVNRHHHARLREMILQVILRRGEGEITDE